MIIDSKIVKCLSTHLDGHALLEGKTEAFSGAECTWQIGNADQPWMDGITVGSLSSCSSSLVLKWGHYM